MALPGFRDFYPDDCAFRNAIFGKWRDVAHRYGFVEYDGPPLEPLDLFTKKSGDEIVTQLYHFKDKGEREVALRPEMTPTLARLVTARHKDFKKPLKWFSIPQVFRYERQQKGRLREHYQLNCDIIGEAGLEADVELIALVIDVLRAFGLTEKDFVVRLSDRQFWTDFMNANGVPEEQRYAFIQAIDKSEREPREKTAEKLGPLAEKVFAILDNAASAPSERLDTIETGLRHRGLHDYVKRDYTVVRGLAYYTGVVWEVFDRSGEFRAIAGGGRYDTLLKNLGGVDLPALGFGMGDVVLGEILKKRAWIQLRRPKQGIYVAVADENYRQHAWKLLHELRQLPAWSVLYSMQSMKLGKQLQQAEELGCCLAIIVDAEIEKDQIGLKDLYTRSQKPLTLGDYRSLHGFWIQKTNEIAEAQKKTLAASQPDGGYSSGG
ncbi:MAG TPA: histidine--tRNA ligase [Candidatus Methylacidiphilales bacterium]|jgi:histidyl-tRNA synthetase|nr:histidine--tRNA ligase [Candidatus Methylacidiphilales bacterium]